MGRLLREARAAGARLRRAVAGADGVVPNAALTDGIELFCARPIRVVFADDALSALLFGGGPASDLAFSGPAAEPTTRGAEAGEAGGYVCLRAGALTRLCEGDPVARFALLHEIGHRLRGDPASLRFSARALEEEKLFATHRFRRQRIDADRLAAITGERGAWREAAARPSGSVLLEQEAAANLFAFFVLADPKSFHPEREELTRWAERHGLPAVAAMAMHRWAPELFGGRRPARRSSASVGAVSSSPWPMRRVAPSFR